MYGLPMDFDMEDIRAPTSNPIVNPTSAPKAVEIFTTDFIPNLFISYSKKSPFIFSLLYGLFHIFKDMEKNGCGT